MAIAVIQTEELRAILREELAAALAAAPKAPSPVTEPETENLTSEDVCRLLSIGQTTLWDYVRTGKIPAPFKVGRRRLWKRGPFIAAIANLKP